MNFLTSKLKAKSTFQQKLLFCLAILYFSLQYVFKDDSAAVFILGALALGMFILSANKRTGVFFDRFPILVFIFVAYCFISVLWAKYDMLAIRRGFSMVKIFVMILLLYVSFVGNLDTRKLLKITMWGGFIAIMYSFLTIGINDIILMAQLGDRMGNEEFINVNVLATLAANVVVINAFFIIHEKLSWDIVIDLPCLLMIAVCGSRRAIIVLIVGILFLYFLKNARQSKLSFIFKSSIVLVVAFFVINYLSNMPMFYVISSRMEGMTNFLSGTGPVDNSLDVRAQMIEVGFKLFQENPILGIGLDNARMFNPKYGAYLHNNYAELAADLGIIGLLLFYGIILYPLFKIYKTKGYNTNYYAAVVTLIFSMLLSDYGVVSFYYKEYYFYIIIFYIYLNELNINKKNILRLQWKEKEK